MTQEVNTNVSQRPVVDVDASIQPSGALARWGRKLVSRVTHGGLVEVEVPGARAVTRARWRFPRPPLYLTTFLLFVLLPSIANAFYLGFIASDQYVAVSRFAVRTAVGEKQVEVPTNAASSASSGLGSTAVTGQDAYVIVTYVRSHAIITDLSKTIDLRAMFRSPVADFWARLKKDANAEELLAYWQDMVTASVDGPSGIVTIRARAFSPQDAKTLVEGIIKASEVLANDVSARSRADMVDRAEAEVRRSEAAVRSALKDLRDYREGVGYIDPVATATMTNKLMLQLLGEKIRLENEYFVSSRVTSETAPGVMSIKASIQSVDQQIEKLKASLTGATEEGRSIAASLVRFETLELKRVFSEKLLVSSEDALERAKLRADRQNIYISVFVPPSLPEEARYPERAAMSIIVPISLLVLWGIFALLVATIDDHRY